jgi:hypothetical protein
VTSTFTTGAGFDFSQPTSHPLSGKRRHHHGRSDDDIDHLQRGDGSGAHQHLQRLAANPQHAYTVVPTTLSFSPDFKTVTLTPTSPLAESTIYDLVIYGNNFWPYDIAGNSFSYSGYVTYNSGYVFSEFTTGTTTAVNGACGTANGGSFSAPPTANLCSTGTASGLTMPRAAAYLELRRPVWRHSSLLLGHCHSGQRLLRAAQRPGLLVEGRRRRHRPHGQQQRNAGERRGLCPRPSQRRLQLQRQQPVCADRPARPGPGRPANPEQQNGSSWYQVITTSQVPLNQWVLVTATATANNPAQVYFNGVLQPTMTPSGETVWNGTISYTGSGDGFAIGQTVNENYSFNGLIDEVQVYNTNLTAAQVQSIYNAGNAGVCP